MVFDRVSSDATQHFIFSNKTYDITQIRSECLYVCLSSKHGKFALVHFVWWRDQPADQYQLPEVRSNVYGTVGSAMRIYERWLNAVMLSCEHPESPGIHELVHNIRKCYILVRPHKQTLFGNNSLLFLVLGAVLMLFLVFYSLFVGIVP